jgi:hypothetical protein
MLKIFTARDAETLTVCPACRRGDPASKAVRNRQAGKWKNWSHRQLTSVNTN